ncbi:Zinc metalloproteinase nas-39, partial [Toxocara canis]
FFGENNFRGILSAFGSKGEGGNVNWQASSLVHYGFKGSGSSRILSAGTCGGVIKATNGTFFSPNFPLNYPPMKNCVWQVEADEGYQIIVNFTHFNVEGMKTECAYDYVLIEDEGGGEERYCVTTHNRSSIRRHRIGSKHILSLIIR